MEVTNGYTDQWKDEFVTYNKSVYVAPDTLAVTIY